MDDKRILQLFRRNRPYIQAEVYANEADTPAEETDLISKLNARRKARTAQIARRVEVRMQKRMEQAENREKLFERFDKSRFTRKAEARIDDRRFLEKLKTSSLKLSDVVIKAKDGLKTVLDYAFGRESDIGMRIYAIASLIYFISPLDFIPDYIPGVGFIEDIAIIGIIAGTITSRILKKKDSIELVNIVKTTMIETKNNRDGNVSNAKPFDNIVDNVMEKAKTRFSEAAAEQMKKQVKTRMIVVIISLSGAIIAAVVTLLLKFYFKV